MHGHYLGWMDVVLNVIPEPAEGTRSVLVSSAATPHPFIVGEGEVKGDVNWLCGSCGFRLAESLMPREVQITNMVFKCPRCGAYNESRN